MREKQFVLMCDCTCDSGIVFRVNGDLFVSTFSGDFYKFQGSFLSELKDNIRLLFTRKKYLTEIITTPDRLTELRDFLSRANITSCDEHEKNKSHLVFETEADLEGVCFVTLICDMSWKEILQGKRYRCHELLLNRKETNRLLMKIDKCIASATVSKI